MRNEVQKLYKVIQRDKREKKNLVRFVHQQVVKKLLILILVPRKTPLKNFTTPDNVIIVYSGSKKTFDQNTIKDCFIQRLLGPEVLRQNHKKSVLYLDNATCHTTSGVKS